MFFLMFMFIAIFLLSLFLSNVNFNMLKYSNKMEVECGIFGFLNKNSNSFLYILFLIIFLIFDLEMVLMIPQMTKMLNIFMIIFLLLITLSLLMELFEISIKWNDYLKFKDCKS